MTQKLILYLFTGLVVIALVLAALFLTNFDDIEVTIHNLGPDTLENVVVSTRQASYPVGDIRRTESAVIGIDVLGDSDLSVRHAGHLERQVTDTYMTRGFTGRMSVMLRGGELIGFTEDLGICIWFCNFEPPF